jgi:beta-aspartyl-peptidase (threonine type)
MTWRLMVHGGCGAMRPGGLNPDQDEAARSGPAQRSTPRADLARGGSALDAVEAAARVLEDDPIFNADAQRPQYRAYRSDAAS